MSILAIIYVMHIKINNGRSELLTFAASPVTSDIMNYAANVLISTISAFREKDISEIVTIEYLNSSMYLMLSMKPFQAPSQNGSPVIAI